MDDEGSKRFIECAHLLYNIIIITGMFSGWNRSGRALKKESKYSLTEMRLSFVVIVRYARE
jgi:hypothetical protein